MEFLNIENEFEKEKIDNPKCTQTNCVKGFLNANNAWASRLLYFGSAGKEHQTQLVPIPPETLQIPGRASRHLGELSFIAGHVPPLGFKSFFVSKQTNAAEKSKMTTPKGPSSIGYDGVSTSDT